MASPASSHASAGTSQYEPNRLHARPDGFQARPNSLAVSTQQPSLGREGTSRGEAIEGYVQTVIMLAIGVAAGAASFTHVHDVAAAHGQPGWLAWTDAIVLELASIAAGLDLRRRRRAGKNVRFPAIVLIVAVALSLSAQVVHAEPSVIGWLAAAVPALGFLAMVKMALGRADPDQTAAVPDAEAKVSAQHDRAQDRPAAVPDEASRVAGSPQAPGTTVDVTMLLPAAIEAAQNLNSQGISLNRTTLAKQLRADGHQLSTAAATALVRHLRSSAVTAPADVTGDSLATGAAPVSLETL